MSGGFLDTLRGAYSSLRRSVIDPETGRALVTSEPTGEVVQRSSVLPVGRDDGGRLVPALPGLAMQAVEAVRFPGQVYRGEASIFDPASGHVSDEAVGKGLDLAGLAMTGGVGWAMKGAGETALGAGPIRAYHGSPHSFDRFDVSKLGTDEGAQSYGHGLYFAENEAVARIYRDMLSPTAFRADGVPITDDLGQIIAKGVLHYNTPLDEIIANSARGLKEREVAAPNDPDTAFLRQHLERAREMREARLDTTSTGHMYEVAIDVDPARMLDWDAPVTSQSKAVQEFSAFAFSKSQKQGSMRGLGLSELNGQDIGYVARRLGGTPAELAADMQMVGIPGVCYLDAGSRFVGDTDKTRNYVTFGDDNVSIVRKYGLAGAVGGGAAAAALTGGDAKAAPASERKPMPGLFDDIPFASPAGAPSAPSAGGAPGARPGLFDFVPFANAGGAPTATAMPGAGAAPQQDTGAGPSTVADVVQGAGAGIIKGAGGLVDLPQNALGFFDGLFGSVTDKAGKGVRAVAGNAPLSEAEAEQARAAVKGGLPLPHELPRPGAAATGALEAATGKLYEPQTRAGKFARTAAEFVPGAGRKLGEVAAYGLAPGLASEGAVQLTESSALEPWARGAAAVGTGLGGAAVRARTSAEGMASRRAQGATAEQVDQAEAMFREAAERGLPLTRANALDAVTGGVTSLSDLQRVVEGSGRLRGFFAPTAEGVLDTIATAGARPSSAASCRTRPVPVWPRPRKARPWRRPSTPPGPGSAPSRPAS